MVTRDDSFVITDPEGNDIADEDLTVTMPFTEDVVQHINLQDDTAILEGSARISYEHMFNEDEFKSRFIQDVPQSQVEHVSFGGLKFGTDSVDVTSIDSLHHTGRNPFTGSDEIRSEFNEGDHAGTYQNGDKFAMRHTHFMFSYLESRDGQTDS